MIEAAAPDDLVCAEVTRLSLRPGEILIVRPKDGEWSIATCEALRDRLQARLPEAIKNRFLIVSEPMDLDVVGSLLHG